MTYVLISDQFDGSLTEFPVPALHMGKHILNVWCNVSETPKPRNNVIIFYSGFLMCSNMGSVFFHGVHAGNQYWAEHVP